MEMVVVLEREYYHTIFLYFFKDFIGRLDTTLGSIIGEHSGHFETKLE
jgi:hypothetical protein